MGRSAADRGLPCWNSRRRGTVSGRAEAVGRTGGDDVTLPDQDLPTEPAPVAALVALASRHGGTAGLADEIAAGLRSELPGGQVIVHRCAEVADVGGFGAVVLASGVYFGHWLEEARDLVLRCAIGLWDRPVWLFS